MSQLLSEHRIAAVRQDLDQNQRGPAVQQRHKPPTRLSQPRALMVACAPMHSQANLSQIVRMAGNSGLKKIIACGHGRVDRRVARDAADTVEVEVRRSIGPVMRRLSNHGYQVVALEQATRSESLHHFSFEKRTALIIGSERAGLSEEELALADRIVEIPVYGLPYSYNAATATMLALYEYCKQHPEG